jgi:uncharacterized protein (DUF433 family)
MNAHARPDLFETGIYTVTDAARLIRATPAKVRRWVDGRAGKQSPVIENDLGRVGNTNAVSFTNLMELRFIAFFSNAGIRLNVIRAIMDETRDILEHPHPFATKTIFRTDGGKIVAAIMRKNGVTDIYDLRSKNYEFPAVVMESLKGDIVYDPSGNAAAWYPRHQLAPNVLVHPRLSFGRPVLEHSRIPTATIARAVRAEESVRTVARMYEIPEKQVRQAVVFQDDIRGAT